MANKTMTKRITPRHLRVGFYWNPKNLGTSMANLMRAATLLRLEIQAVTDSGVPRTDSGADQSDALDRLLEVLWPAFGPSARQSLRERVTAVTWPSTPDP